MLAITEAAGPPLPASSILLLQEAIESAWEAGLDTLSSSTLLSLRGKQGVEAHIGAHSNLVPGLRIGLGVRVQGHCSLSHPDSIMVRVERGM